MGGVGSRPAKILHKLLHGALSEKPYCQDRLKWIAFEQFDNFSSPWRNLLCIWHVVTDPIGIIYIYGMVQPRLINKNFLSVMMYTYIHTCMHYMVGTLFSKP